MCEQPEHHHGVLEFALIVRDILGILEQNLVLADQLWTNGVLLSYIALANQLIELK